MKQIKHKTSDNRQMHPKVIKRELGWDTKSPAPSYDDLLAVALLKYWEKRSVA